MRKKSSLDAAYFDRLYAESSDPWKFASSSYERGKYDETINAIGSERVINALEVGCSIGVLTARLAQCCDRLLAVDVSASALDQARDRCRGLGNIEFCLVHLPNERLKQKFDLIILSEVVYYWDSDDLKNAAEMVRSTLLRNGRLLLVHWLGETDYPKSGDEAVIELYSYLSSSLNVEKSDRFSDYRLDLWRRT